MKNNLNKYVIRPLSIEELNQFFDENAINTINYFIAKAVFSQPELLTHQDSNPIHVPKEHIEQWIVQSLGVTPVGAGSYAVDVISKNEWGADVKMLSCKVVDGKLKNSESGETSLSQKFTGTGSDLDRLFLEKKYNDIIDGFKNIYFEKISDVMKEKKLSNIYYFFILRANLKFYLCGMKIDINNVKNVTYLRNTKQNVWTKYFLDEKYGSVRIYKAKKRMGLRLLPKKWYEEKLLYEFNITGDIPRLNIKELLSDNNNSKIENHIMNQIKSNFKKILS